MPMCREISLRLIFSASLALAAVLTAGPVHADPLKTKRSEASARSPSSDLSAQRRTTRRNRITVRPARGLGPLRRECVPVFEERLIPQWGGRVLYASQRCWWTRAPLAPDEVY